MSSSGRYWLRASRSGASFSISSVDAHPLLGPTLPRAGCVELHPAALHRGVLARCHDRISLELSNDVRRGIPGISCVLAVLGAMRRSWRDQRLGARAVARCSIRGHVADRSRRRRSRLPFDLELWRRAFHDSGGKPEDRHGWTRGTGGTLRAGSDVAGLRRDAHPNRRRSHAAWACSKENRSCAMSLMLVYRQRRKLRWWIRSIAGSWRCILRSELEWPDEDVADVPWLWCNPIDSAHEEGFVQRIPSVDLAVALLSTSCRTC